LNDPHWILPEVVPAIHSRQLAEHGGSEGIREEALLESALARPLNKWAYSSPPPSLYELAASYGYGVVRNHPFVDGNKRTGFVLMLLFLRLNGIRVEASDADKYQLVIRLAEGSLSEEELADWLSVHGRPA